MKTRAIGNKVLIQSTSLPEEISDSKVGLTFKNGRGSIGVVLDKGAGVTSEIKKSDLVVFDEDCGISFQSPSSTGNQFLLTSDAIYAIIGSGKAEDSFENLRRRICDL